MIVRLANETGGCFVTVAYSATVSGDWFREDALRGDFVDCAEGNSIARLQGWNR
jgi:hypothetical protein